MSLLRPYRMDKYDMNIDHENQSLDVAQDCHENTIVSLKTSKCNKCKVIFPSLDHLNQHKKFNKCKMTSDGKLFRQPNSHKSIRKTLLCNRCGKKGFTNKNGLRKHQALNKCIRVSFGKKQQNMLPELEDDMDQVKLQFSEDSLYPVVPFVADQKCQNINPELSKKKKRIFRCQFCGKTCLTKATYNRHKAIVCKYRSYQVLHGALQTVKPFLCQICGTGFRYRRNLLRHERKSECNVIDTLEIYQNISSGEDNQEISTDKPFETPGNISVAQNQMSRSHLKRKIRVPKSCHECEICLETFSTKSSFDRHFNIKCKKKSKLGALVDTFVTCVKGRSNTKSVRCSDCGVCFRKQIYLNQHLKFKRCKSLLKDNSQMVMPSEDESMNNSNSSQKMKSLDVNSRNNGIHGEELRKRVQKPPLDANLDVGLYCRVKNEVEKSHELDLIKDSHDADPNTNETLHNMKEGIKWNGSYTVDQSHVMKVDMQDVSDSKDNSDLCKLSLEDITDSRDDFMKDRQLDAQQKKINKFPCKQKVVNRKKSRKCPQCRKMFVSVSNLNKHIRLKRCRNVSSASWEFLKKYPFRHTNKKSLRVKSVDKCNATPLSHLHNDTNPFPSKRESKRNEIQCSDLVGLNSTHDEIGVLKDAEVSSVQPLDVLHLADPIKLRNHFSDMTEYIPENRISGKREWDFRRKPLSKKEINVEIKDEVHDIHEDHFTKGITSFGVLEGFIKEELLEASQSELQIRKQDERVGIDSALQTSNESDKTSHDVLGHIQSTFESEMTEKKKLKTCFKCGHSFVSSSNLNRHIRLNRCKSVLHNDEKHVIERPVSNHNLRRKSSSSLRNPGKCMFFSSSQVKEEDSLQTAAKDYNDILAGPREENAKTLHDNMIVDADTPEVTNVLQNKNPVNCEDQEVYRKSKQKTAKGCKVANQNSEVVGGISYTAHDDVSHEVYFDKVRPKGKKVLNKPIFCNDCGRKFLKKKYLVQHKKLKRCKQTSADYSSFPLRLDNVMKGGSSEMCNYLVSNQSEVAVLLEGLLEDRKRDSENPDLPEKATVVDEVENSMNLMAAKLAYFAGLDLMLKTPSSEYKCHLKSGEAKGMFPRYQITSGKNKKNDKSLPPLQRKSFAKREGPISCSDCGREFLKRKYLFQHIKLNRCKAFVPKGHQPLPRRLGKEGKDNFSLPTLSDSVPSNINEYSIVVGKPYMPDVKGEVEQIVSMKAEDNTNQSDICLGEQSPKEENVTKSKVSCPSNVEMSECHLPYLSTVPNEVAEVKKKNDVASAYSHRVQTIAKRAKPLDCSECGRDFSRKRDLLKHKKLKLCKIDLLKDSQTSIVNSVNIPEGHGLLPQNDDFPSNIKVINDELQSKNYVHFCEQDKLSYRQRKLTDPLQERGGGKGEETLLPEMKRHSKTKKRPSSFISRRKTKITKEQNISCNDCGRQFLRKRYLYVHKKLNRCKIVSVQEHKSLSVKQESQIKDESSEKYSAGVDSQNFIVKVTSNNVPVYNPNNSVENDGDSEMDVRTGDLPEQSGIMNLLLNQSEGENNLSEMLLKTKAIRQVETDSCSQSPKNQPKGNDVGKDEIVVVKQSVEKSRAKAVCQKIHLVSRETTTTEMFDAGPLNIKQNELNRSSSSSQTNNTRQTNVSSSLQDMLEMISSIDSSSGKKAKLWRCQHCRKHFSYKSNCVKHCRLNVCKKKEHRKELFSYIKQENDHSKERICFDEKECHESGVMSSLNNRHELLAFKSSLELKVEPQEKYDSDGLHQDHPECLFKMLREAHKRKSYSCWACEEEFSKLSYLDSHLELNKCKCMLPEHVLSCCICGKCFSNLSSLNKHLNLKKCKPTKQKYTPWQCPCGKYFSSISNRNKHQKLKRCKTLPPEQYLSLDEHNGMLKESLLSSCSQIDSIKKEPYYDHNEECDDSNFEVENEDFSSSGVVPEIIMKEQHSPSVLECFYDDESRDSKPISESVCVRPISCEEGDELNVLDHFLANKGEEESHENSWITQRQETYCNSDMPSDSHSTIPTKEMHKVAEKPFKCHICDKGFMYNKNRIRHVRLKRCKFARDRSNDKAREESPKLGICRKSSSSLKIRFWKRTKIQRKSNI